VGGRRGGVGLGVDGSLYRYESGEFSWTGLDWTD
jgi:hypothetical protein